jgi:hypothetical protein
MRTGDGRPIPARLKIEIEREWKRLKVVAEQVREVEAERDRLVKGSEPSGDACTEKMRQLVKLHVSAPSLPQCSRGKSSIDRSRTAGKSPATSA